MRGKKAFKGRTVRLKWQAKIFLFPTKSQLCRVYKYLGEEGFFLRGGGVELELTHLLGHEGALLDRGEAGHQAGGVPARLLGVQVTGLCSSKFQNYMRFIAIYLKPSYC